MKNPILASIIGLANTGLSIIKDKRQEIHPSEKTLGESVEKGLSLSSTKIMGYGAGGAIITLALAQIEQAGANKENLTILAIGAGVTIATQIIAYFKERPASPQK